MGWLQRLSDGLTKTRDVVRGSLDRLLGRAADPALLEEFEAALIASDLGARVVDRVMVLDHGEKIAEGPPEAVRRDEEVIRAYLGRSAAFA